MTLSDAQIRAHVSDVFDEMLTMPVGTTVGDVLRQRARRGDALAAAVLEDANPNFLNSTIAELPR